MRHVTSSMAKRFIQTISEPRFQAVAAIVSYAVIILLGVELLPILYDQYPLIYWVPGVFMLVGALVGLPVAWIGGPKAARVELISMPITIGGLLGGAVIEATEVGNNFTSHILLTLGIIVLLSVAVRWHWLRNRYSL